MKFLLRIYGLKWRIRNSHVLGEKGGAVIISNHQSALDILGINLSYLYNTFYTSIIAEI